MRDLERWKEQVELSLDGRQIFFLFFGSAVAACVLFIAGVLVGKRIEQRACMPTAAADPLAVLDQLSDDGLTFHQALGRRERTPTRRAEASRGRSEPELRSDEPPKPVVTPIAAATPRTQPASADATAVHNREESDAVRIAVADSTKKPDAKKPDNQIKLQNKQILPSGRPQVSQENRKPPPLTQVPIRKVDGATPPPANSTDGERYTLQISAFTEKSEAEEFIRKIQSTGYRPFLVQRDIPGRGTFYRVRLGDYSSRKAANDAKAEFERKQHLPVYVVRL